METRGYDWLRKIEVHFHFENFDADNSIIQLTFILCESVNIKRANYRCCATRARLILTPMSSHLVSLIRFSLYCTRCINWITHVDYVVCGGSHVSMMLRCLLACSRQQKPTQIETDDRKFPMEIHTNGENHEKRLSMLVQLKYQFHGFAPLDVVAAAVAVAALIWGRFDWMKVYLAVRCGCRNFNFTKQ